MFALVDCNNFYVSCERVFKPVLNNKPVIVLSNNDGCVISRSQEAKDLGIKMGEPAFKRQKFFEQNNVAIFSSNYTLYGDMSQRIMNTLSDFVPEIEIYSIDEAFLNFSGLQIQKSNGLQIQKSSFDLQKYCEEIRNRVLKWTGMPVSIGVGSTKTLSKIANRIAKKQKISSGVKILQSENEINTALIETPISDVWGVGRKYAKYLNKHKVYNAYEFTQLPDAIIRKKMTVRGLRTKKELIGENCIPMELSPPAKKAIATTRSFGKLLTDIKDIREAVTMYADSCATKLRQQKSVAKYLMVFIHTNYFRKDLPQYAKNRVITLPVPTNSSIEIVKYSVLALKDIFRKGYKYKKAGVIVSGIMSEQNIQTNLFEQTDFKKQKKLMQSMDKIRTKYGKSSLKFAIQGDGEKWKLRQENLTQAYTTKWNELLEVK